MNNDWISTGLKYTNMPEVLDQTELPHKTVWLKIATLDQMVEAIQSLRVRGAPLIASAAVMALYHYVSEQSRDAKTFEAARLKLREARPTAVNLMNDLDSMKASLKNSETITAASLFPWTDAYFKRELGFYDQIARHGSTLFQERDTVLTHCNTGALATFGRGTALGVLAFAFEQKKSLHVYVDETRPLLQGARLTTWELSKLGIPHTLICDNMAASLMGQGKISKVIVGADRISRNGDFANKIGTYGVAVLAFYHRIPFYVAAPTATVDLSISSGSEIPIETRDPREVRGFRNSENKIAWAEESTPAWNPSFDVTPNDLVTGYIFETGVLKAHEISELGKK